MEISPKQDAILTNGDFIEASIMAGDSPVIFIGTQTVPLQVIDYLKAVAGETNTTSLRVELTDIDLVDNPWVRVQVAYGERPTLLIKSEDKKLPLDVAGGIPAKPAMIGLASAILLLVIGMIYKRKAGAKSEKCAKCGNTRPEGAEFCPRGGPQIPVMVGAKRAAGI